MEFAGVDLCEASSNGMGLRECWLVHVLFFLWQFVGRLLMCLFYNMIIRENNCCICHVVHRLHSGIIYCLSIYIFSSYSCQGIFHIKI